ncbi:MAG: hypothetical protein ABI162_03565 [Luteolibacter sp.]
MSLPETISALTQEKKDLEAAAVIAVKNGMFGAAANLRDRAKEIERTLEALQSVRSETA